MVTTVLATRNASKLIIIIYHKEKCGLRGQSVQVLEGPNYHSGIFRRGQVSSPLWATD